MGAEWNTYTQRIVYIIVSNPDTLRTTIYKSDGVTEVYWNELGQDYWQPGFSYPITIGYAVEGGRSFYFYGDIAEIRLYNHALTDTTTPRLADVAETLRTKWGVA